MNLYNDQPQRALEILEDELVALRPTRRQRVAYQLLHLDIAVFVAALGIGSFVWLVLDRRPLAAFTASGFVGLFATLALLILIPLNIPLIVRLWRGARIRRQLGFGDSLTMAFREQRRRSWLRNLATALLVVVGAYLARYAVVYLINAFPSFAQSPVSVRAVVLVIAFLYLVVGVTLVGLHFVGRALDRFAVVLERVHASVTAAVEQAMQRGANHVPVGPDDYELIAQVERDQIMRDRLESVEEGEQHDAGYAVQIGLEAQQAKAALPLADRLRVDAEIFRLAQSAAGRREPITHSVQVPETQIELRFDVDHAAHRIRIVGINEIGQIGGSQLGTAELIPS